MDAILTLGELVGRAFSLRLPRESGYEEQWDLPRMCSGAWMWIVLPVEGLMSEGTEVGENESV